jgi:hypothetical protein
MKEMKIMSETRLTVEQIIAAVNQLELEELTMLNKHLSKLHREKMCDLAETERELLSAEISRKKQSEGPLLFTP